MVFRRCESWKKIYVFFSCSTRWYNFHKKIQIKILKEASSKNFIVITTKLSIVKLLIFSYKGTFLGATRGFRSSVVEIVGGHEHIKSHKEFCANGPLCALWAISLFNWKMLFSKILLILHQSFGAKIYNIIRKGR